MPTRHLKVPMAGVFKIKCKWMHRSAQSCLTLCNCSPPGLCPRSSLGENSGVGCHSLSRGSFRPSNHTQGSCSAGRLFTIWSPYEISGWCLITEEGRVRTQGGGGLPASCEGRPREKPADTFVLDFQPPELEEKIWLFQPLSVGFFVMEALSHQNSLHGQQQSTSLTISPSSQIFSQPIFCCKCESSDTSMTRLGPLW